MTACTGLWLTFCDTLFVYKTIEFSAVAINWLPTSAFKKLYAILCLKETLGFDWIFVFRRPKNLDFLFWLSLLRVLFDCHFDETVLFELMITCTGLWLTCFVILFLSTWLFIIPRLLSSALLLLLSKLYTILCLKDTLGFDWIFVFFWRPKNLDLPHLLSLFCVLFDCDCDETVLFELMITCTGLWLTCFVILFLYSRLWVFRGCSRLACYFCVKNVSSNFVPQGNAWLWLNLCFSET